MDAQFEALISAVGHDAHILAQAIVAQMGVNARDADGRTPLMVAQYFQAKDLVDYLVSQGADHNLMDKEGRRAADYANLGASRELVAGMHEVLVQSLLQKVSDQRLASMPADQLIENRKMSDRKRGL